MLLSLARLTMMARISVYVCRECSPAHCAWWIAKETTLILASGLPLMNEFYHNTENSTIRKGTGQILPIERNTLRCQHKAATLWDCIVRLHQICCESHYQFNLNFLEPCLFLFSHSSSLPACKSWEYFVGCFVAILGNKRNIFWFFLWCPDCHFWFCLCSLYMSGPIGFLCGCQ